MAKEWCIGIIGGSGLYDIAGIEDEQWLMIDTPWGDPSDEVLFGTIGGVKVRFLPRHGRGHPISPTGLNARANIDALKRAGCTDILAISAVGSLREEIEPGRFAVVEQMIEAHPKELGITPRKISDDEIVHRLVYSLVNEGARILEEGIASKASDIDMVYLTGYGFPLHRGGPMCYADTQGLFNVVQTMKRFAANPLDDAAFWQPAPLLAKLAAEGKSFT